MKGIILAGGANTRLLPMTAGVSKQLLPVYDKPMIYYPLSVLMLAGIREILVISTPRDTPRFEALLGDGAGLGLKLSYVVQEKPRGIAEAFILAREFLAGGPCMLVLGDNILFGHGLPEELADAVRHNDGATIFGYEVEDPARYGVVTFDHGGRATAIEEKPQEPRSSWAVIGLYLYDGRVAEIAAGLQASARGELEITDVNRWYLDHGQLQVRRLGRGYAWIDAGTFESLHEAATFVRTLQRRQGYLIACVEEVAFRMGYIGADQLRQHAQRYSSSDYGRYLRRLVG